MKLSKITQTPKFKSATLVIDKDGNVEARIFTDVVRTKRYKSLVIDLPTTDSNLSNVKHLGYSQYKTWENSDVENNKYVNIYYTGGIKDTYQIAKDPTKNKINLYKNSGSKVGEFSISDFGTAFGWDGEAAIGFFLDVLTDCNYHTERKQIEQALNTPAN